MSAEKSKRMTDYVISLKCVCLQIVLFHDLCLFFGIDKLVKRYLLGLKDAIFIRGVALFTCMKQQSVSL